MFLLGIYGDRGQDAMDTHPLPSPLTLRVYKTAAGSSTPRKEAFFFPEELQAINNLQCSAERDRF